MLERQFGRCFICACKLSINGGVWAHRRTRSVRDLHCMCPCNGLYLCKTDDAWCAANRFEAVSKGLLVSRHVGDPSTIPVWHTLYGWLDLDHDGGFEHNLERQDDR